MVLEEVSIQELLDTGAHFGHLTRKWNPQMEPYIFSAKNSIHLIDLRKTQESLRDACNIVGKTVAGGGYVLFAGTKKQAKGVVKNEAQRCGMYYIVERWLGGSLTNFMTIRRSIKRLEQFEDDGANMYEGLKKKEVLSLERERLKLETTFSGIKEMKRLPDIMVVVDSNHEEIAVKEANRLDIPVIGIVDTDGDPSMIDYIIPANDDSIRTISLIVNRLAEAVITARGMPSEESNTETSETKTEEQS